MQSTIKKFNSKSSIFLFITVIHVTLISLYFLPYYVNGDQYHYRALYFGLNGLSLSDGFLFYKNAVSSEEPIYFFISWLLSNWGIDKDIFITISNIVLAIFSYKTFLKLGAKPYISYLVVCFNFYFLVFYFSAERLKFALIFLFIFYVLKRLKLLYVALSILSHSQVLIVYISMLAPKIKLFLFDVFIRFRAKYIYLWAIPLFVVGVVAILAVLGNHISSKVDAYYSESNTAVELIKMLAFFALSFLYSKNKADTIYAFVPLLVFVFLLGGERVNVIGYFVFLYFSLHYRGGLNFGVIVANLYFIFMGYEFLTNILSYGNGF